MRPISRLASKALEVANVETAPFHAPGRHPCKILESHNTVSRSRKADCIAHLDQVSFEYHGQAKPQIAIWMIACLLVENLAVPLLVVQGHDWYIMTMEIDGRIMYSASTSGSRPTVPCAHHRRRSTSRHLRDPTYVKVSCLSAVRAATTGFDDRFCF